MIYNIIKLLVYDIYYNIIIIVLLFIFMQTKKNILKYGNKGSMECNKVLLIIP